MRKEEERFITNLQILKNHNVTEHQITRGHVNTNGFTALEIFTYLDEYQNKTGISSISHKANPVLAF